MQHQDHPLGLYTGRAAPISGSRGAPLVRQYDFTLGPSPGIHPLAVVGPPEQDNRVQQNNITNRHFESGIAYQRACDFTYTPEVTVQPNPGVQSNVAEVLQDFGDSFDYHALYHQSREELPQFQQEPPPSTEYGLDVPYNSSFGTDTQEDRPVTATGFHCGCCLLQQALNTVYQDGAVPNVDRAPTPTRASTPTRRARNVDAKHFCTVLGCTRSFGRTYDLNRHLKTIHSGMIYWCPVPGCERNNRFTGASRFAGVGFKRLDKLKGHMKKAHHM